MWRVARNGERQSRRFARRRVQPLGGPYPGQESYTMAVKKTVAKAKKPAKKAAKPKKAAKKAAKKR